MARYTNLMGCGELDATKALEDAEASAKRAKASMAEAVSGFDALDAAGDYVIAHHLVVRMKDLTARLAHDAERNGDPALTVALYHDQLLDRVMDGPQDGWSGNGLRNVAERMRSAVDREVLEWLERVRVNDRLVGGQVGAGIAPTRVSDTQTTVGWSNNSSALAPYASLSVQRWDNVTGSWYTVESGLSASSVTYADTSTVANRRYQYRVVAVNATGSAVGAVSWLLAQKARRYEQSERDLAMDDMWGFDPYDTREW